MRSLLNGIVGGIVGFALGAGLTMLVRVGMGKEAVEFGPLMVMGYLFGVMGWLLGVGVWGTWAREWLGLSAKAFEPVGWRRYFGFNTDHKVIGIQYLVTFIVLFLLAGLLAMTMRYELMEPGRDILSPAQYNRTMSLHGMLMISVAVASVIGGFGNYFVPLMIGTDDMAFPRMNALSYWMVPPVAILLLGSQFFGGWDSGWTAYPPLSVINKEGQLLFNLAFLTFGLSSIVGSINFVVTIVAMRAPGMSWGRLPIFVWSMLCVSVLGVVFTQFIAGAMLLVILERVTGMAFFDADRGGDPVLYQHLFWFYSHPAVYIMVLPGLGLMLEVITHFSRKPLFAYKWAVGGFVGITSMSMIVWAHHMFTAGIGQALLPWFLTTTEMISIPTGFIFLAALGTIWRGKLWLQAPMLFALAAVFNFLIGGVTGVFLADVPADLQLHDTYFVVAHFHYTIVGAELFGLMAGIYYWFPKMTGRMYNQGLAKLHFWWMFIGFNLTFIPMFKVGLDGMNRRVADYPEPYGEMNLIISASAFFLGAGFLVFVYNLTRAWFAGRQAPANPWNARTLEWQTSSPPPLHNFAEQPVVTEHPYDYGLEGLTPGMSLTEAVGAEER